MRNIRLQYRLEQVRRENAALLATNFYNYETLEGIVLAAKDANSPIILQLTQSSIEYMSLPVAVKMGRTILKDHDVEGYIHLDHGGSVELVKRCIDEGFDSVMIDASEEPLERNAEITLEVVKYAERYGVNVEAELGYIAKLGQDKDKLGFTEPNDAKLFVESTGVDALAISIGSAHGFYKKEPKLDMDLLSLIRQATNAYLVLHGSSGIPHHLLQEAINRGICKINLATEIKNIFMQTLKNDLMHSDEIDLRKIFPKATQSVRKLVSEKLDVVRNQKIFS